MAQDPELKPDPVTTGPPGRPDQQDVADSDGYALERRVRLTLQMESGAAVAQVGKNDASLDQTDCW